MIIPNVLTIAKKINPGILSVLFKKKFSTKINIVTTKVTNPNIDEAFDSKELFLLNSKSYILFSSSIPKSDISPLSDFFPRFDKN